MTIQQVTNNMVAAAVNLPPGKTAPQAATATPPPVQAQAQAVSAIPQQPAVPSFEQVQQAMKEVAKTVQAKASNLEFSMDKDTGSMVVKIVDSQTKEVIRQIPAQEMIDIAHAIDKMQGLLVQQKA
jgi:flagellar protein FlaG